MIRHYVTCECNNKFVMIRDNSYNTCKYCDGHEISLYTFEGSTEEIEGLEGKVCS